MSRSPTATRWAREHHRARSQCRGTARPPYVRGRRPGVNREPWLVFSGDSLLIGDVGRPDLRRRRGARAGAAAALKPAPAARAARLRRALPEPLRGLGLRPRAPANPVSSIGFERAHNPFLAIADADAFADALAADMPPPPAEQKRIVAANRSGKVVARA